MLMFFLGPIPSSPPFSCSPLSKQEGATKEDIEQLSKFKFRRIANNEKLAGDVQGPFGGIMTECGTDSPIEHVLSDEDAVCTLIFPFFFSSFLLFSPTIIIIVA
jgi:hypothetical protein